MSDEVSKRRLTPKEHKQRRDAAKISARRRKMLAGTLGAIAVGGATAVAMRGSSDADGPVVPKAPSPQAPKASSPQVPKVMVPRVNVSSETGVSIRTKRPSPITQASPIGSVRSKGSMRKPSLMASGGQYVRSPSDVPRSPKTTLQDEASTTSPKKGVSGNRTAGTVGIRVKGGGKLDQQMADLERRYKDMKPGHPNYETAKRNFEREQARILAERRAGGEREYTREERYQNRLAMEEQYRLEAEGEAAKKAAKEAADAAKREAAGLPPKKKREKKTKDTPPRRAAMVPGAETMTPSEVALARLGERQGAMTERYQRKIRENLLDLTVSDEEQRKRHFELNDKLDAGISRYRRLHDRIEGRIAGEKAQGLRWADTKRGSLTLLEARRNEVNANYNIEMQRVRQVAADRAAAVGKPVNERQLDRELLRIGAKFRSQFDELNAAEDAARAKHGMEPIDRKGKARARAGEFFGRVETGEKRIKQIEARRERILEANTARIKALTEKALLGAISGSGTAEDHRKEVKAIAEKHQQAMETLARLEHRVRGKYGVEIEFEPSERYKALLDSYASTWKFWSDPEMEVNRNPYSRNLPGQKTFGKSIDSPEELDDVFEILADIQRQALLRPRDERTGRYLPQPARAMGLTPLRKAIDGGPAAVHVNAPLRRKRKKIRKSLTAAEHRQRREAARSRRRKNKGMRTAAAALGLGAATTAMQAQLNSRRVRDLRWEANRDIRTSLHTQRRKEAETYISGVRKREAQLERRIKGLENYARKNNLARDSISQEIAGAKQWTQNENARAKQEYVSALRSISAQHKGYADRVNAPVSRRQRASELWSGRPSYGQIEGFKLRKEQIEKYRRKGNLTRAEMVQRQQAAQASARARRAGTGQQRTDQERQMARIAAKRRRGEELTDDERRMIRENREAQHYQRVQRNVRRRALMTALSTGAVVAGSKGWAGRDSFDHDRRHIEFRYGLGARNYGVRVEHRQPGYGSRVHGRIPVVGSKRLGAITLDTRDGEAKGIYVAVPVPRRKQKFGKSTKIKSHGQTIKISRSGKVKVRNRRQRARRVAMIAGAGAIAAGSVRKDEPIEKHPAGVAHDHGVRYGKDPGRRTISRKAGGRHGTNRQGHDVRGRYTASSRKRNRRRKLIAAGAVGSAVGAAYVSRDIKRGATWVQNTRHARRDMQHGRVVRTQTGFNGVDELGERRKRKSAG